MKFNIIFSVLLLTFFSNSNAQSLENSLLWKITNPKDPEHCSYLFGTIHMISNEHFYMPDTLTAILQKSDSVCFELNIDNPMEMMMGILSMGPKLFLPDKKSLDDYLTPAEMKKFDAHFEQSTFPAEMLKRLKPMFILAMLENNDEEMSEVKSYEIELSALATEYQIPTCGLEKMEDQLKIFDKIPVEDQVNELIKTLNKPTGQSSSTMLDSLVFHYTNQNLNKLDEMIGREFYLYDQNYADLFLNDRNRNWIQTMDRQIQNSKNCLYAIGAGHLGGKNGLIALLRDKNYNVEPIFFDWMLPNEAK